MEYAELSYVSLADGQLGEIPIQDDGTATADLPKGDYEFISATGAPDDYLVGGLRGVTVDDDTSTVAFDGTESHAITSPLEGADVDQGVGIAEFGVDSMNDGPSPVFSFRLVPDTEFYMLPFEPGEDETHRKMAYFPSYTEDENRYYLGFEELDGVAEDIDYSVEADDLVEVNTRYGSLGLDEDGLAGPCGFAAHFGGGMCELYDTEFPSEHTAFLLDSDSVFWEDRAEIGPNREEAIFVHDEIDLGEGEPIERDMVNAPLTLNLSGSYLGRFEDSIEAYFLPIDNGKETEFIMTDQVTGTLTLEQEGEVLDSVDDVMGELALPEGDAGRYTLTVEASHESEVTELASEVRGTWEFESEPSDEEFVPLNVSSIVFHSEEVRDGYAPANSPLDFIMEYLPQDDMVEAATLDSLTVEVSYNDGDSWEEISVDVDGNEATGTLDLDDGAEFASVRTEVTDTDGNVITQETIRAFGLN